MSQRWCNNGHDVLIQPSEVVSVQSGRILFLAVILRRSCFSGSGRYCASVVPWILGIAV